MPKIRKATMKRLAEAHKALTRAGGGITWVVGTMYVAIVFAALSLVALPDVIASHNLLITVQWITQSFLQLVLLPIIIVGQNVQGARTEARDIETHDVVMAEHAEIKAIVAAIHATVIDS